jgi:hypothetical protein
MQTSARRAAYFHAGIAAAILWGCQGLLGIEEGTLRSETMDAGGAGASAGAKATGGAGGSATCTGGSGGVPSSGGTGGTMSTGGVAGSGGTVPTGGSGGAGGTDASVIDPYTCFARQAERDPDPGGSLAEGGSCCLSGQTTGYWGMHGVCTPSASLWDDPLASHYGYVDCDRAADLRCAPLFDAADPDGGGGPSRLCTIDLEGTTYEGRCVPRCFTLGMPAASLLNEGDCEAVEDPVCVPCYSPLDGASTGACTLADDAPVDPFPMPLASCGRYPNDDPDASYLGRCVSHLVAQVLIPDLTLIPQDICAQGQLCLPTSKLENPVSCFERCDSNFGAGACAPTYIVEAPGSPGEGLSDLLGQQTCETGETCTPCLNALDNNNPTGACEQ